MQCLIGAWVNFCSNFLWLATPAYVVGLTGRVAAAAVRSRSRSRTGKEWVGAKADGEDDLFARNLTTRTVVTLKTSR